MNLDYKNLDTLESYRRLTKLPRPAHLRTLVTVDRIASSSVPAGGGMTYNYGAKLFSPEILGALQDLADEAGLIAKYRRILDGGIMNTGEKRMVLHHLVRGRPGKETTHGGRDLRAFYRGEQDKIAVFADRVHRGEIRGSTGKPFDTVVQIGIGGSDLGPRALHIALSNLRAGDGPFRKMKARFVSNVDPDDAAEVLARVNPETSLFIVVSKSGTTQETLTNQAFVLRRLEEAGIPGLDPKKHLVAVTSETSPMAKSPDYLASFFIDDFIGGRYSATSAVGGAVLSLAFGPGVFEEVLAGAAEPDRLALEGDIRRNAALMDALLGVYERNVLGFPATAVLPYSQALSRFPAHLQQLDMESNGKGVNRFGEALSYPTGPVIFGEPGTNGQHSFYQLLHQGTDIVPLQFIGFRESQRGEDLSFDGSTSQKKLNANLAAQILAFAKGKDDADPNKSFGGNRPSSLLWGEKLTPRALGATLAHFENKVMFQGLAWNINSFDQEGVQLGKVLASEVLSGAPADRELAAYARLLGVL